jgi:hypothetical protein
LAVNYGPKLIHKIDPRWDDIQDPEERKKAILAKHGFKPANELAGKRLDNVDDIDTIPEHILRDEVLYR